MTGRRSVVERTYTWTGVPLAMTPPWTSRHLAELPLGWMRWLEPEGGGGGGGLEPVEPPRAALTAASKRLLSAGDVRMTPLV